MKGKTQNPEIDLCFDSESENQLRLRNAHGEW